MEGGVGGEVIALAKGKEARAVDAEQAEASRERGKFVEIEGEEEEPIREAVRAGVKPGVHDATFVEAGKHACGDVTSGNGGRTQAWPIDRRSTGFSMGRKPEGRFAGKGGA